ncbi:uncharacterized protein LOC113233057 isoform X2 [Hyposmocoma kahamanoa]|uniref:uncharacterized protein LOC113233057 isoform X2 n=1 Tax=Hyposmocoma kahamanoa TaxID=1477025 RepID=UPI000E6D8968|nr:uncharacterized protein LOC113233057 isoform X2 [Hyposmocoma kahamanoa]
MNIDTGLEVPRARPLSAGLWTLLSWLRREEHSSNDSLSSVGSDGTAVSFAFLAPPPPRARTAGVPLTPVSPSTDSYRKRVRDRNVRRQHDRDLTLRSKYGLYRADNGYDALTLPSTRRSLIDNSDKENRERRAVSESSERRAAYVPGKRRAPLPPNFTATHPTSLTHRRTSRKRPAPKPPVMLDQSKEREKQDTLNIPPLMNSKSMHVNPLTNRTSNESKLEKCNKKDDQTKGTTKHKSEKSFLKLLFESKKRNSTMETVPERILPSISELDKQAAAIIESCKLKTLNENDPNGSSSHVQTWFCTKCLRKYDSTVVSCPNCLSEQNINFNGLIPENKTLHSKPSDAYTQTQNAASPIRVVSSNRSGIEAKEKQELKEMLKEMKNSLPKRPKHDSNEKITTKNINERNVSTFETPTLRIGSTLSGEVNKLELNPQPTSSKIDASTNCGSFNNGSNESGKIKPKATETVVVTQHVVLVAAPKDELDQLSKPNDVESNKTNYIKTNDSSISNDDLSLHTPLKISSLLNPIYVPKNSTENQVRRTLFLNQAGSQAKQRQIAEKQTSVITTNVTTPSTSIISTNKLNEAQEVHKMKMTHPDDVKSKEKENQKPVLSLTSLSSRTANESNSSQIEPKQMSGLKCQDKILSPLVSVPPVPNSSTSNNIRLTVEQHSRRRELINQLEKSIAKGDEAAAADAAMKLAQLRLSCSVLSFSSQIVDESSKLSLNQLPTVGLHTISSNQSNLKSPSTVAKVHASVQSTEIVSLNKISKNKDEITVTEQKLINPTLSSEVATRSQETKQHSFYEIGGELPKPKQIEEPSTSNSTAKGRSNDLRTIEVWVEDREATRGPICLHISRQASMGELRRHAQTTLGLDSRLQRWIIGRALCTNDKIPLADLAGPNLASPFYLCVVESETNSVLSSQGKEREQKIDAKNAGDVYSELVQLEKRALILSTETFECGVCLEEYSTGKGVVLRECLHTFCTQCLSDLVRYCEEAVISCPAIGCSGILQEREIRELVTPEEYEKWLARGLAAAESGTRNAFHCRTRDCTGWALCDPGVRVFPCPVCKHINCIPCEAIHEAETCEEYRAKQEILKVPSKQTDGTQAFLETLIIKGEALRCPECSAVITKKWGCDWVKCSACKTEICWVTRGRRWGPGGRGDTSGGCRCGVDGKRCHPSCGYCH